MKVYYSTTLSGSISLIPLLNKYLLSTHSKPGTLLGEKDKKDELNVVPVLMAVHGIQGS